MKRLSRVFASAAMLAAAAGAAHAQFVVERAAQPGAERQTDRQTERSVQSITIIGDDRRVEIRVEDGRVVVARVNGSDWPPDRIEFADGRVVLRNADGSEAHSFEISTPRPPRAPTPVAPARVRVVAPSAPGAPTPPAPPAAPGAGPDSGMTFVVTPTVSEPPPVMLGINLSDPGDALREQLGLGDKPAILVESVFKGLPAITAGIRRYDVIVSIDGSDGASRATLQEVLRRSSPGDEVDFAIVRGGERKTITVKLEAYNASKLGLDMPQPPPQFAWAERDDGVQAIDERLEAARRRYAENPDDPSALERVQALTAERARATSRMMGDRARGMGAEAQTEHMRELERLHAETLEKVESAMRNAERQVLELRNGRLFVRSAEEAQRSIEDLSRSLRENRPEIDRAIEDRVRSMEDRLGRLEERLEGGMDRLESLLERLSDRLERESQRDPNG
jgi:hypothetical protein